MNTFLIFNSLVRALFGLAEYGVPFDILPFGFRVVFEKPTIVTSYEPIKISGSVSSLSSISAYISFRRAF
jgi:hypothetical protein